MNKSLVNGYNRLIEEANTKIKNPNWMQRQKLELGLKLTPKV